MSAQVETMAYTASQGRPWHGEGVPVSDDMTTEQMLKAAGLDWTVSKRPLYFPKNVDGKKVMRIVPDEFALVRDSDESVLDTVGAIFNPVQNHEILDFFRRYVEAGDMTLETAGSLRGGRFIWALAKLHTDFTVGKSDTSVGYVLLSQPHLFGHSLGACLTAVRVVCQNTLQAAIGTQEDGATLKGFNNFRMTHARVFDDKVRAEAETALGLMQDKMKAYGHTAQFLSETSASEAETINYFRDVLRIEQPKDDTEAARLEAEENENRNMKRLREALISAPGQDIAKGTWWAALNATTYFVDHQMGRDENRLYNAWYGRGRPIKDRALNLAVEYAKIAA
jgi:phage/plasmid-like protein (TIGR03299 family)